MSVSWSITKQMSALIKPDSLYGQYLVSLYLEALFYVMFILSLVVLV